MVTRSAVTYLSVSVLFRSTWFKGHAIRIRIFAKRACWLRHFSPFVRIYRRVSHWTDFRKTRDCGLCEKSVQKIQILLQSDKNTRQFTRRLKYVSLFPPTWFRHTIIVVQYLMFYIFTVTCVDRDSSVGIATCCGLDGPGIEYSLFQWPSGLRRGSAANRLLGLQVRIPPGHGCLCCVLSSSVICHTTGP